MTGHQDQQGRRALLLSGSIGMGHDTLAEACSATLESDGWSTRTLDLMRLLGRGGGSIGNAVFRSMIAAPGVYDAFHFAVLRTGNRFADLTDAAARRQIEPRLRGLLDVNRIDLAISVFATGASAISRLAPRYPAMSHVVFCTDATPHRLWVHPNVDLYLLTSEVAERAVRRFEPDARVLVVPAPLRAAFYDPPSQQRARQRLGIPEHERCALLMSGAWGIGPVAEAAAALGEAGVHVLAVAGQNERLERKLQAASRRQPRVRAIGYTERIPELMAASDLVITSSGDTCTEARTVGRPLLLLDVVQGHGRDNLQHELELGDASVTSGPPVGRRPLSAGRARGREATAHESDQVLRGLAERVLDRAGVHRPVTWHALAAPDPQVGGVGPGRRRETGRRHPAHQPDLVPRSPARRLPVPRLRVRQPLRCAPLQDEFGAAQPHVVVAEQPAAQQRRERERRAGDHVERPPRQRHPAQIVFDDADQRLGREAPPQPPGKCGI